MTTIQNPGDALRTIQAILRHHGYATDQVESVREEHDSEWFRVTGQLVDPDSLRTVGTFEAAIPESGTDWAIRSVNFGWITESGNDPFVDL